MLGKCCLSKRQRSKSAGPGEQEQIEAGDTGSLKGVR
jgi:hypothetical protein